MEINPSENNIENQFENIVSLVLARSRGEVENDAVEKALSSIVPSNTNNNEPTDTVGGNMNPSKNRRIIPDCDNYDDDDDGNNAEPPEKPAPKRRGRPRKNKLEPKPEPPSPMRDEKIGQIPLGRMGERMLVTFGDGSKPRPEVIDAALLGARLCIQQAILDARALRRRLKDKWHQAKAATKSHSNKSFQENIKKASDRASQAGDVVDTEMYFRAMEGNDRLRFNLACGFDTAQLEQLFPEEMRAYQRWKKMHKAYSQNSGDDIKGCKDDDDDDYNEDTEPNVSKNNTNDTTIQDGKLDDDDDDNQDVDTSGRLGQRLANFDARTHQMKSDYYLKFADVRRGSFLPKRMGISGDAKEWREKRKSMKGRGTSWQSLHPSSVVFLHWIGFDQRSALAPPNEETTQALGFLAYDIFGKIVEKAVSFRLESTKTSGVKRKLPDGENPILELTAGDQLEKKDVEEALKAVNIKSLYRSGDVDLGKSSEVAQLYFGPGFEDRLEIELDEMFGKKLSDEEVKVRQEEENLFSDIAKRPTLLTNMTDVLDGDEHAIENESGKKSAPAAKKKKLDS